MRALSERSVAERACSKVNWRVVIVAAAAVALICWAGVIALDQQDRVDAAQRYGAALKASPYCVKSDGAFDTFATGPVCPEGDISANGPGLAPVLFTWRDRVRGWLRFAGVSIVVLALAAIPWMSERRRAATPP
jgi:hypothetical protein